MFNETLFHSLPYARAILEAWRADYNNERPYSRVAGRLDEPRHLRRRTAVRYAAPRRPLRSADRRHHRPRIRVRGSVRLPAGSSGPAFRPDDGRDADDGSVRSQHRSIRQRRGRRSRGPFRMPKLTMEQGAMESLVTFQIFRQLEASTPPSELP
jgi:hypothetical protein